MMDSYAKGSRASRSPLLPPVFMNDSGVYTYTLKVSSYVPVTKKKEREQMNKIKIFILGFLKVDIG